MLASLEFPVSLAYPGDCGKNKIPRKKTITMTYLGEVWIGCWFSFSKKVAIL